MAAELNIGIDSLVFVDDADFEVNLIRAQVSEFMASQVPKLLPQYPDMVRAIPPLCTTLDHIGPFLIAMDYFSNSINHKSGSESWTV